MKVVEKQRKNRTNKMKKQRNSEIQKCHTRKEVEKEINGETGKRHKESFCHH
jgi:hypothetical protein